MKAHTYTEKNKDTEMKIEIPTPTPAASVRQTRHNSTKAQTETGKQAIPHHTCKRPLRRQARSPTQPDSQVKCRQTVDISCMNWNHCMNRGRLYIYI